MDNSNNPNNPFSPQNTAPVSGSTPPQSPPDINPFTQTPPQPPASANPPWQPQNIPPSPPSPTFSQPEPISSPWDIPQPIPPIQSAPIQPEPAPLSSQQPDLSVNPQIYPQNPVFPSPDLSSQATQTTPQPSPVQPQPSPLSQPPQDSSFWNPPLQNQAPTQPEPSQTQPEPPVEPTPTFTPPPSRGMQSDLSPLDNPLGAPAQPPPIDGPDQTTPPAWSPPSQPAGESTQAAPTDLSHLISTNNSQEQPQSTAETLIVPTTASPEVPNLPTEERRGIPKWMIGVGIGLLLLVTGASAYFILGIGRKPETSSVPATTQTQTSQIKPPPPVATPVAQPTPQSTGSANFGELGGAQQATSAADLLRQRQQQTIH